MDDDVITVSQDQRRIDMARARQMAVAIRRAIPDLSVGDAESLAVALAMSAAAGNSNPTGDELRRNIEAQGRSKDAAMRITSAVGL